MVSNLAVLTQFRGCNYECEVQLDVMEICSQLLLQQTLSLYKITAQQDNFLNLNLSWSTSC